MKINIAFLAASLLLALGGVTRTSPGAPRAKPAPQPYVTQKLSPAEIETLRQKAGQIRDARKRAIAQQRKEDAKSAATMRRMQLSSQDWKGLFRSVENSRKVILPLLGKLPVSTMEQDSFAQIKPCLGEMYTTVASRFVTRPYKGAVGILLDMQTLQLVTIQCMAIEATLIGLQNDSRQFRSEIEAPLAAIRDTRRQSQLLLDRMRSTPAEPSQSPTRQL